MSEPPADMQLPGRITREELARHWRISVRTLLRWEADGIGPRPLRIGGRVLYRREDVLALELGQIAHQSDGTDD